MQIFPPTVVLRHNRENLKKCSLRGLETRTDFRFYRYPKSKLPDLTGYILLSLDAPPLSLEESHLGLFVLDSSWRYAERMMRWVEPQGSFIKRSIPSHFRTAYPRRQDDCLDPERGLASIEAIYLAYHLLGRETTGLLDNYYWKEEFFRKNSITHD